ncbi:pyrroline-5-carboxylate reductase [Bartonella sp. DGB1]|uniref:pyrroline-5-carboxylate reductase n=1 Tax=Bartonella sp. DGB1 TaxID=3239807 RepID=UPI0035251F83
MKKILLIGCGKMGFALLQRWVKYIDPQNIYVVQPSQHSRDKVAELGVHVFSKVDELPELTNIIVVFAVKPQVLLDILPSYKYLITKAIFLTVVAGVTEVVYQQKLGENLALVRVMPNTPSAIGEGVLGYWANDLVAEEDIKIVETLLSYNGYSFLVKNELDLDKVTALSGSGSAYVFYFLEVMIKMAQEYGFNEETAYKIAQNTVKGAVLLSEKSDFSIEELRQQVTSPNGTTQKALEILMHQTHGLFPLLKNTILAAEKRSKELGAAVSNNLNNKL